MLGYKLVYMVITLMSQAFLNYFYFPMAEQFALGDGAKLTASAYSSDLFHKTLIFITSEICLPTSEIQNLLNLSFSSNMTSI